MVCLLGEYFQVHPFKSIEDGLPMGEYFQVHPYKSIEDGLPVGEYFQVHPYKSIEDGVFCLKMGWRVFSSSPL